MIVSVDEIKKYLRIDYSDDDSLLSNMLVASEEYISTSSGKDYSSEDAPEILKLAIKMLVTHWYENRGTVVIGTISGSIDFALKNIIFQLKYK